MLGDRFKRELNKNDYYVVDPKTGREKSLDTDKLVDMAKKALKKAAIVGLIAGSLGTGALGYLFADEVADYKEERAYTKAVIIKAKLSILSIIGVFLIIQSITKQIPPIINKQSDTRKLTNPLVTICLSLTIPRTIIIIIDTKTISLSTI